MFSEECVHTHLHGYFCGLVCLLFLGTEDILDSWFRSGDRPRGYNMSRSVKPHYDQNPQGSSVLYVVLHC